MTKTTGKLTKVDVEQRRKASKKSAQKRWKTLKCKRGHNKWRKTNQGRLQCITCASDRHWYYRKGMKPPKDD